MATPAERATWQADRERVANRVHQLTSRGECFQCRDLDTGGSVLGQQHVIVETQHAKAVLALDPRAPGHTVVVWKPHRHDFTELDEAETATLFTLCRDVASAMTEALAGVKRVYLVTMCDGPVNHLHVQLIPRYRESPIGSTRLVDQRGPLIDGAHIATAIAAILNG